MIGDSVTDCERVRPVGEGLWGGVGKGYVSLVSAFFHSFFPEKEIRVVNMGCSGHTVKDLKARWQTDVFDLNPDWVSILIGVNDVWRQYDSPLQPELHVYLDEYSKILDELVKLTLPKVKGLVLMTPYYIEPHTTDDMRATMDKYGEVVKTIAEKHNVKCVDLQAAFNNVLQYRHSSFLAWDRIHPNTDGHMVIARAFLNAVGFEWEKNKKD